ncbi:LacI family DNA-binding transcriptional regulator [Euzebya tangerina]|uniref:LacI family DNA-binding transcriptional regulator n=1 Tax=Euzebya tangerina TaxID=591198 RepID=UPI000E3132C8|nr:LacI family DNA-binding transcriptional regulator [Euzebya tangerina]
MAKVTLKDVARQAGVHVSTVSRALDPQKSQLVGDSTRARVRAAAVELGYQGDAIASGLRRGRTNTFAIVVADLGNPFIAPVLRGIENGLGGRGVMPLVAETQDDSERMEQVMHAVLGRRVDAVITTAARHGDEQLLRRIARQVPLVLAVRHLPDSGLSAIVHDDERGGRLAAEHLVSAGHRRIAQLCGPVNVSSFQERTAGFRSYLELRSIVSLEPPERAAFPTLQEGQRLMSRLLDSLHEPPTAVFAHNDLMAFGALDVLKERGLSCPEDVAVMGYNDTQMTRYTAPPLTTIRLPGYELGRLAADAATMLIEAGGGATPKLTLPPVLVPRASTMDWSGSARRPD